MYFSGNILVIRKVILHDVLPECAKYDQNQSRLTDGVTNSALLARALAVHYRRVTRQHCIYFIGFTHHIFVIVFKVNDSL